MIRRIKQMRAETKHLIYLTIILVVSNVLALTAAATAYKERFEYARAYENTRASLEAMTRTRTGAITNAFVCRVK